MFKLKTSAIALLAVVAMGAAPALAASLTENSSDDFDASFVQQQLHSKGIDASQVVEWGNQIKATVTLADGSRETRYFTEDGLHPIGQGQSADETRVLGQLNVGANAASVDSNYSLTHDTADD